MATDTQVEMNLPQGYQSAWERQYDPSGAIVQRAVQMPATGGMGVRNQFQPMTGFSPVARPEVTAAVPRPTDFQRTNALAAAGGGFYTPPRTLEPVSQMVTRLKAGDNVGLSYAPGARAAAQTTIAEQQMVAQREHDQQNMTPEQRQIMEDARVVGMPNAMKLAQQRAATGRTAMTTGAGVQKTQMQIDAQKTMTEITGKQKENILRLSDELASTRDEKQFANKLTELRTEFGLRAGENEKDLAFNREKLIAMKEQAKANRDFDMFELITKTESAENIAEYRGKLGTMEGKIKGAGAMPRTDLSKAKQGATTTPEVTEAVVTRMSPQDIGEAQKFANSVSWDEAFKQFKDGTWNKTKWDDYQEAVAIDAAYSKKITKKATAAVGD